MRLLVLLFFLFAFSNEIVAQEDYKRSDTLSWDAFQLRFSDPQKGIAILKEQLKVVTAENYYWGKMKANQYLGEVYQVLGNADSCEYYVKESLALSDKEKDLRQSGRNYGTLGRLYNEAGQQSKSIKAYHSALQCFVAKKDTYNIAYTYADIGFMYAQLDNLDSAMVNITRSLHLAESIQDSLQIGYAYNQMGMIHKRMGNLQKAKEVLHKGIDLLEVFTADSWLIQSLYNEAGILYKTLGEYDTSLNFYEKIEKSCQGPNDKRCMLLVYINRGILYNKMKKYNLAETDLKQGVVITKELKMTVSQADALNNLGESFLRQGKYSEALPAIKEAIVLAKKASSLEKELEANLMAKEYYIEVGNPELAVLHMEKHQSIKDSMFYLEKAKQIDELQTKYETSKKDAEITALNKNAEIEAGKKKLLIGGFGLATALGLALFYGLYQRREKEKALLVKQKELEVEKRKNIEQELEFKKKELTAKVLQLAAKNEFLGQLQKEIHNSDQTKEVSSKLVKKIDYEMGENEMWEQFSKEFSSLHDDFLSNLKKDHGSFTKSEVRLISLMKMNLTSKDIANILHISGEGVKKARQRLRRKLGLTSDVNLQEYLLNV